MLIPEENVKDLAEIPDNVKNRLEIHPVKWIDSVIDMALERKTEPLSEEQDVAPQRLSGRSTRADRCQTLKAVNRRRAVPVSNRALCRPFFESATIPVRCSAVCSLTPENFSVRRSSVTLRRFFSYSRFSACYKAATAFRSGISPNYPNETIIALPPSQVEGGTAPELHL